MTRSKSLKCPARRGNASRARARFAGRHSGFRSMEATGRRRACASSARAEETGYDAPPRMSETTSDSWGWRPDGDAPRSEASALRAQRLLPARPQPPIVSAPSRDGVDPCSAAPARASETAVDGSPAAVDHDRPASGENAGVQSDAPPEESGSTSAAQASKPTADSPKSPFHGSNGLWILLLLVACCWWFVTSGRGAALRGSPASSCPANANSAHDELAIRPTRAVALDTRAIATALFEQRPNDKARRFWGARSRSGASDPSLCPRCCSHHAPRDGMPHAEREDCFKTGKACGPWRRDRSKPPAQNKATAIGSGSAGSPRQVASSLMRQRGNSALRKLSADLCDVQDANRKESRKPGRAHSVLSCIPAFLGLSLRHLAEYLQPF